jgi:two-component system NtrC family response regulator
MAMTEPISTPSPTPLLVVDDDTGIQRQLRWAFDDFATTTCGDRGAALSALHKTKAPVVLLDLGLPPDPDGPSEGLTALREILGARPDAKVIVLTGQRERAYALKAVGLGAYDYYQKPVDIDELRLIVARAANMHALEQENREQQAAVGKSAVPELVTGNADMQRVSDQIARFADANVAVLITGESGTGKELLAHGLHTLSSRKDREYVAINCAAIPENLLESELFGYERGAFTGAHKTTIGKFEQAHKGTLLLDEIGDLPATLQAKLLRVLQDHTIERIGGRKRIPVDFRLVAATNRDLEQLVADGHFREDLYYRISEVRVRIPPLRERPEDAPLIAQRFLESWTHAQNMGRISFTNDGVAAIRAHTWPGNVRELQNRVKRAALTATGGRIGPEALELAEGEARPVQSLRDARKSAEFSALQEALRQANGNISETARLLGVSRPKLYQLLDDHDLR